MAQNLVQVVVFTTHEGRMRLDENLEQWNSVEDLRIWMEKKVYSSIRKVTIQQLVRHKARKLIESAPGVYTAEVLGEENEFEAVQEDVKYDWQARTFWAGEAVNLLAYPDPEAAALACTRLNDDDDWETVRANARSFLGLPSIGG